MTLLLNSTKNGGITVILLAVVIAFVVGGVLFRLVIPKGSSTTAVQFGRTWCAWMLLLFTTAFLPGVLYKPFSINALAAWLAGLVVYGGITFLLGWVYGTFRFRKSRNKSQSIAQSEVWAGSSETPS